MPSLAEFQRDFAAQLRAPLPVDAAGPLAGLSVHRNTFMKGLVDALLANYPTVAVLMGDAWTAEAAIAYARQCPPHHAVLARYGESFPDFLRGLDVARDWSCLPGVAELDLAWTQSLLAPDVPALVPARLTEMDPSALGSLQLTLHPGAHPVVCAHSAVTVWRANRPPAVPPAELLIEDAEEAALILRAPDGVTCLPLDAAARTFIESLASGNNIATATCAALAAEPHADFAAIWSALLIHGAFADIGNGGD
jgi:hypothetical protein